MFFRGRQHAGQRGISYVELMVCVAIIMVLAAGAVPLTRISIKRQKEIELKAALRDIRRAIDEYKNATDAGRIIGSPDAGPDPQQSGDRGGWAQLLTLGALAAGVGFITWRIVAAARRAPGSTGAEP